MKTSLRLSILLVLLISFASLAQPPSAVKDPPRVEEIKLPADAVIVLYDKASDALKMLPKFVLVSPEKYNALLADVERLTKQTQNRQPSPVNAWRISGKVVGNVVELKASIAFTVERERTSVTLGCGRAQATSVMVDGKVPPLWLGPEGLVVEVEKGDKPDKTAEIKMLVPIRDINPTVPPRTGSLTEPLQGFDLDLPLTPVTSVDLEMPEGIKSVEVNDQVLGPTLTLSGRRLNGPLGRVSRLKLAWKAPQSLAASQPLLTSNGSIAVSMQGTQVLTEVWLTIQDLGRTAKDFQLQVPSRAQVRLLNTSDRERLRADIQGSESDDGRVTIPLATQGGEPLTVVITTRRPRGNGPFPLGPFTVLGAMTQTGILDLVGDPNQIYSCVPFHRGRGTFSATKRAIDEKRRPEARPIPAGTIASFNYWAESTERIDSRDPWFKLDSDTLVGLLDTKVTHTLQLGNTGPSDWRLTTTLDLTQVRTEVDQLEMDWPSPWLLDRERGPRSRSNVGIKFKEDLVRRMLYLELDPEGLKPFDLKLDAQANDADVRMGALPSVADHPHSSAVLKLPRPRGTRDRGGHQVIIEARDQDLRVVQPANPGLVLETQETHRLVYRTDPRIDKFVSQVAVAWKVFRPEVRVDSLVDAVLLNGEARIRHRLAYQFLEEGETLPTEVVLRVPVEVGSERLRIVEGAKLLDETPSEGPMGMRRPGRSERLLRCKVEPRSGNILVVEYVIPLPTSARGKEALEPLQRLLSLPLLSAESATHGQCRIRLWAESGTRLKAIQAAWEEKDLEIVADRDRLPSAVFLAHRPATALTLRVESPATSGAVSPVLFERALIQVRVGEGGFQHHHARFLVRQINGKTLDLDFPVPLSSLDLQVLYDGKTLNWRPLDSASDSEAGEDRKTYPCRVDLPGPSSARIAALEVIYQLSPTRSGLVNSLQSVLHPVGIPSVTAGVPVRWQIDLPSGAVPLPLDSDAMWRWGRRGWLLAPRPAVNAGDIERWFWGEDDSPVNTLSEEEGQRVPAHVCWRTSLTPLTLYHVPQQAWLLGCSLLVMVIGLGLSHAAFSGERGKGRLFWGLVTILGVTAAAIGLVWPGLLTVLAYGGQPGLVVLLVILLIQWLLHERYRRRVVFLPGFKRVKSGSSLVRKVRPEVPTMPGTPLKDEPGTAEQPGRSSAARPRHEPSTVDAPLQ